MKFKERLKYEKENMNKIRYFMNYRIAPMYILINLICFIIISVLLEIDEKRYTPTAIGLFILLGVITIFLFISTPFIRKVEIGIEMERYDFNTNNVKQKDIYDFSSQDLIFYFNKDGVHINDTFIWRLYLKAIINTSNYLNRIWISVVFFYDNDYYEILLSGKIIHIIDTLDIKLENREVLDFIVNHKEEAFIKIYKTGHI